MVRIKHRYLLVNILYPEATKRYADVPGGKDVPLVMQFRRSSDDRVDARMLARIIREGVAELFGDYGSGMIASSLQGISNSSTHTVLRARANANSVKYFSPATSTAIIRVSRDHLRLVWSALAFTTHLPKPVDQACVMQVARVSGTIKKAEEEAIRRAQITIRRAQKASARAKAAANGNATAGAQAVTDDADVDENVDMDFANGIEDADAPGDLDDDDY